MKKLLTALSFLGLLSLLIPLINMFPLPKKPQVRANNSEEFDAVAAIVEKKCIDCHSSAGKIPFYGRFPVVKNLIERDIDQGRARFFLDGKLEHNGELFTELDLARLEGVIYNNSMSPIRYRILHWDSGLTAHEKTTIKDWIYNFRKKRREKMGLSGTHLGEPIAPLVIDKNLDKEKIELGKLLFHDKRLSKDETISCASCHSLKKGGTDQSITSVGIRGQIGPINAPTVFNAVYNHRQFWDGRARDLEEQAGGPVTNPKEMGADWDEVLAKLDKDIHLQASFKKSYSDGISKQNILNAIAIFEQSLVTPNSRFDNFLYGKEDALSQKEKDGYQLFKQNCIACHAGTNVGGLSFEKMGMKKDYFGTRERPISDADFGLYNFTQDSFDKYKFKVPSLRNIALTYPYFHDGSAKNLEEAIALMADHQLAKKLTPLEIEQIAAFLKTLTGEYEGRLLDN